MGDACGVASANTGPRGPNGSHAGCRLSAHKSKKISNDVVRVLMLPVSSHRPPQTDQPLIRLKIACPIARDLGAPVIGIRLRHDEVLRATMPEATIQEHCNARFREDDICTTTLVRGVRCEVHSISNSGREQFRPHLAFDRRVLSSVRLHRAPSVLRTGSWNLRFTSHVQTLTALRSGAPSHMCAQLSGRNVCWCTWVTIVLTKSASSSGISTSPETCCRFRMNARAYARRELPV